MALNTDWKEFLSLLVSNDVEFLIVGAWARSFYGEPRMTGDIDFWINPTASNAEKLVEVIRRFGFASLGLQQADFTKEDQVIQLGFPPRRIDLLTKLTALEFDDCWQRREVSELDGLAVAYLSKSDFLKNKLALGRPKDLADIDALVSGE